jgi:hypothetical protein
MCLYIVTQASKQAGPVGSAWSVHGRHFLCESVRVVRSGAPLFIYDG